ncbi:hypothetical protein SpCBS45565_g07707 [Spizellomyces sp. 'palustris']|nr:hypothetical protein SpCBS45565_g07707 [Spizellomyces sp. 'palustris']
MVKKLKLSTHEWANHKHHHIPPWTQPPDTIALDKALTETFHQVHQSSQSPATDPIVIQIQSAQMRYINVIQTDGTRGPPSIRITLVPSPKAHDLQTLYNALESDLEMRRVVYEYRERFINKKEWYKYGVLKNFLGIDERNLKLLRRALRNLEKALEMHNERAENESVQHKEISQAKKGEVFAREE